MKMQKGDYSIKHLATFWTILKTSLLQNLLWVLLGKIGLLLFQLMLTLMTGMPERSQKGFEPTTSTSVPLLNINAENR